MTKFLSLLFSTYPSSSILSIILFFSIYFCIRLAFLNQFLLGFHLTWLTAHSPCVTACRLLISFTAYVRSPARVRAWSLPFCSLCLCLCPMSDIIPKRSKHHDSFADDTQLQQSGNLLQLPDVMKAIQDCNYDLMAWMTANNFNWMMIKLNSCLLPQRNYKNIYYSFSLCLSTMKPSSSLRLSVIWCHSGQYSVSWHR